MLPGLITLRQGLGRSKHGLHGSRCCCTPQGLNHNTHTKHYQEKMNWYGEGICTQRNIHIHVVRSCLLKPFQVSAHELDSILYVDCTKLGVLSQTTINAVGELAERVLFKNPSCYLDMFTTENNVPCVEPCVPNQPRGPSNHGVIESKAMSWS